MFLFLNKQYPSADQPHLCPIVNNGITQCKCLLNTSRHCTNLVLAHKLSMSHQNPPSATIQNPSTPTLSHTIASPVHSSPLPSTLSHSSNSLDLTLPPPTPSISSANRLDDSSHTFVPQAAAKHTIKKADGTEVSLENLTESTPHQQHLLYHHL